MLEFDALPRAHIICVRGIHVVYNIRYTLHFIWIKNFCLYNTSVCTVGPVTVYWDIKHNVTVLKP
jgi:hypothetical protein